MPSLGDLPNPCTEPRSPALQEDSLLSEPSYPSLNKDIPSILGTVHWPSSTGEKQVPEKQNFQLL